MVVLTSNDPFAWDVWSGTGRDDLPDVGTIASFLVAYFDSVLRGLLRAEFPLPAVKLVGFCSAELAEVYNLIELGPRGISHRRPAAHS